MVKAGRTEFRLLAVHRVADLTADQRVISSAILRHGAPVETRARRGAPRLGELAVVRGVEIDLVVVGGAAMVLGFGARAATKDVDVVIRAPAAALVRQLAAALADELGWPTDWLNDAAKGFVGQPSPGPILLEAPGIIARAVSVQHLLALKLAAWRDDVDIDDARLLLRNCPPEGSRDALWSRVEVFVPRGREQTAWYAFLDLWEEVHGAD